MTSSVASARLDALVAAHPSICTRGHWPAGHAGATVGYVKVGAAPAGSPTPRRKVLLSGGVHSRELAPPDALVSFLDKLLTAYGGSSSAAVVYPSWTQPTVPPVVYDSFSIPPADVRAVIEHLDLYVAPMVNPDGRDWVLAPLPAGASYAVQELHKMWRKNRRPRPPGTTDDWCVGVDLNRNFDILWDFTTAYSSAALAAGGVSSSTDPCDREVYAGPSVESEPETKSLAGLMRTQSIGYFLDVHQHGRDIVYPWGTDTNQTSDRAKSFTNRAWDHRRDALSGTAYSEFIPASTQSALIAMANRMKFSILTRAGGSDPTAQTRSKYLVSQSATGLYATSGVSDDYCFSRAFTASGSGSGVEPILAFTIEVGKAGSPGGDDDGGFSPDFVRQYPKLEREIHAAVWGFLAAIVALPAPAPPPAPPGPTPGPTPDPSSGGTAPKSSGPCFVASAVYGDATHPSVAFLRDVRDRQLTASPGGARFAGILASAYRWAGPRVAARLQGSRWAPAAVRILLLQPLVACLQATSACLARRPRLRAGALTAVFLLAAAAALGLTAVGLDLLIRLAARVRA
jgi:murein tripeptide amidase MpaA